MFILRAINALFDRIFAFSGAILFSQVPGLIAQYYSILRGAAAEARRNSEGFKSQAALLGRDLKSFIGEHIKSTDPLFRASGKVMQETINRSEELERGVEALNGADLWERPILFFYYFDWNLIKELKFTPVLPLSIEGFVYAIAGLIAGSGFYYFIRFFVLIIFRRKKNLSRNQ